MVWCFDLILNSQIIGLSGVYCIAKVSGEKNGVKKISETNLI
jgi:hypothetical protein